MIYVFVFLGEFGYELLNWQGVIRKFIATKKLPEDKVICCSRAYLSPLYEGADLYIDISELPYFKNSVANMYWAHNPDCQIFTKYGQENKNTINWEIFSEKDKLYQQKMYKQIEKFVMDKLDENNFGNIYDLKFIFSSEALELSGLSFGPSKEVLAKKGGIYEDLNLDNNLFQKINADETMSKEIEKKLGFSLREPYVLCQDGYREIVQRSKDKISKQSLISDIAESINVVLLSFSTGRNLDSYSDFRKVNGCYEYDCSSFLEQSCLIQNAKTCLFFTEGDFRSHNYVPPFLGKNVYSVAPKTVFDINTSPLDFWNSNVFRFGGKIIPICSEDLIDNDDKGVIYDEFIRTILN